MATSRIGDEGHEGRIGERSRLIDQGGERYPRPSAAGSTPTGDAVNVELQRLVGKIHVPGECQFTWILDKTTDDEGPGS